MSSPAQVLPFSQVMAIMNQEYFHPVGIICFVIMPIKIILEAMILVRIVVRTMNRKAVPLAMQLPGYMALSLLIGQTCIDAKLIYQFRAQQWILGTPCLALTAIWLFCFEWMGLFMAITGAQYMVSIVRPRFLSPANRFMNAKSLHLPALIALVPAAALAAIGSLNIEHTRFCGFNSADTAKKIVVSMIFMLSLVLVLVCYATAIWYLERARGNGIRPSSWSATQGTIRHHSRTTKRATVKLFSYSLLTTLVTIPPIVFPMLYSKVHFPSDQYFHALFADDIILQCVPILLGLIWILNEGILDRDVGWTVWSFSKKSSSVGDSFTESGGNTTDIPSFPSQRVRFPPHPGVNIKGSKVRVEVRPAGVVDRCWEAAIREADMREAAMKENKAASIVHQRESAIEVDEIEAEEEAKDQVDEMATSEEADMITPLSPPPRNSANSQQLKAAMIPEVEENRSSWQSEFFDSTLRNEVESRNTDDQISRASYFSVDSPTEPHQNLSARSSPAVTTASFVTLNSIPSGQQS